MFSVYGKDKVEVTATTRKEIATINTDYVIGSECFCTEDCSVWMLSAKESGEKFWKEMKV